MARLIVYLSDSERAVLKQQAERDLRGLREQARFLIVHGLAAELAPPTELAVSNSHPTLPTRPTEEL